MPPSPQPIRAFFESALPERLRMHPELGRQLKTVLQFEIDGSGGGHFYVDATVEPATVKEGDNAAATSTVRCTDADFEQMMTHRLTPKVALTQGKLRVKGDLG